MPEGHDATIEVCNIMSFVLYTQILKQSVLKPASPGITLNVSFSAMSALIELLNIFYPPQHEARTDLSFSIEMGNTA